MDLVDFLRKEQLSMNHWRMTLNILNDILSLNGKTIH